MSQITEQIEQEISRLSSGVSQKNVGHITAIAGGVAGIDGLSGAV